MDVSESEVRGLSTLTIKALAKRVSTLPEHTRRQLAIREKEKGNEAFHANDYDEALLYYKRSLIAFPLTAVYNNRALIYLHQKKWSAAAKDCAHVLQEEPDNLKALFRSGRANYELHNLEQAEMHLERLTDLEPTNSKAQVSTQLMCCNSFLFQMVLLAVVEVSRHFQIKQLRCSILAAGSAAKYT
ncbi:hypothetical protein AHF37_11444 [Paragonimus kellicotti]|nr:hypothetical protein AHF37_11444 [Paragonimus kellicotti]